MDIIEIIKSYRKEKNYTQAQIAEMLGIDRASYCYLENGKTNLRATDFIKLINYLDIPINILTEENYIIISEKDLTRLKNASKTIDEITNKLEEQKRQISKLSKSNTNNTNIQIGDHNSINNSFNKK